jgi:hypothetical protein
MGLQAGQSMGITRYERRLYRTMAIGCDEEGAPA